MKIFEHLLLIGALCLVVFIMGAAPQQVGSQILVFNETDQEISLPWSITAVAWVSDQASGRDIAADDDMLLEDADGTKIIGARAEAVADDLVISFPIPIRATGLKAEDLDGGILYVYGQQR